MKKNSLLNVLMNDLNLTSLEEKELVLTSSQFDKRYLGKITKKDQINALSVTIEYNEMIEKYSSTIETSSLSESRTIQTGIHESIRIRHQNKILRKERFVWDSLSLKLTEQAVQRIGDIAFGGTIVTVFDCKSCWVKVYIKKELTAKTLYLDVETSVDYTEVDLPSDNRYVIR